MGRERLNRVERVETCRKDGEGIVREERVELVGKEICCLRTMRMWGYFVEKSLVVSRQLSVGSRSFGPSDSQTLCYSASLLLTPARASPSATRFARGIRVKTSMTGWGIL